MNLNEECLLKYLQNPDELPDLTELLSDFLTSGQQTCELVKSV